MGKIIEKKGRYCRCTHLNIICKVTLDLTLKSQEALSAVHVVDNRQ